MVEESRWSRRRVTPDPGQDQDLAPDQVQDQDHAAPGGRGVWVSQCQGAEAGTRRDPGARVDQPGQEAEDQTGSGDNSRDQQASHDSGPDPGMIEMKETFGSDKWIEMFD